MSLAFEDFGGLMVAILGGAAVGVERQRSGHATGPHARLGGVRTFTMLGTLSGVAGLLLDRQMSASATVLLAGAALLTLAGYVRASRHDVDATTEVAAIVVLAAGVLGGLGELRLSAAVTTLTVLLLAEKPRLHGLVARLDEPMMVAAVRFAVMSVVILPLLPEGPFGPGPGIRPRELWMLVLLFTGMSFAAYLLQRMAGAASYALTGLLGGLVSSTSVTLTFARLSRSEPTHAAALAGGAIAASTILFARVCMAVGVLDGTLLPILAIYLAPPFVIGVAASLLMWGSLSSVRSEPAPLKNPLQLRAAVEMAVLFQAVLFAVHYSRALIGEPGMLASGFVLGLTDVDALTLSMTRSVASGTTVDAAGRAITTGIVANSLMKAAIAVVIGSTRFKWQAGVGLFAIAIAGGAALIW